MQNPHIFHLRWTKRLNVRNFSWTVLCVLWVFYGWRPRLDYDFSIYILHWFVCWQLLAIYTCFWRCWADYYLWWVRGHFDDGYFMGYWLEGYLIFWDIILFVPVCIWFCCRFDLCLRWSFSFVLLLLRGRGAVLRGVFKNVFCGFWGVRCVLSCKWLNIFWIIIWVRLLLILRFVLICLKLFLCWIFWAEVWYVCWGFRLWTPCFSGFIFSFSD